MGCPHSRHPAENAAATFHQSLIEAARGWRSKMDARLRPLGLSSAMWSVLSCMVANVYPLTQRELAQAVGVEGPTLVRLLDRLEQGGWARRVADPDNRRIKRVELTEKAAPYFVELRRTEDAVCLELLRDIPKAELAAAHKVLRAIRDRL